MGYKSTGIVRRIDDLGRVVIPKEIRRTLRIKDGDPLELFTDGDYVCFKKYRPSSDGLKELMDELRDIINEDDAFTSLPPEQSASIKALFHVFERDIKEYVYAEGKLDQT